MGEKPHPTTSVEMTGDTNLCHDCGIQRLRDGWNYCPNCGAKRADFTFNE